MMKSSNEVEACPLYPLLRDRVLKVGVITRDLEMGEKRKVCTIW
jgi:hypothetical protein